MFGATVAEHAARELGSRVLVLDRRDHIGGNAFDYVDPETQINVHRYGSHLMHSPNDEVWAYFQRFTDFSPYQHRVFANSGGQVYSFPMNLALLAQVYGRYFTPEEAKAKILDETAGLSAQEATNLEEKAISLIGHTLYEKFVKHYTAKQWQTEPTKLDPSIITRLPVRYNFDNRYFNDKNQGQPLNGYSAMFEKMLAQPSITVQLDTDWFSIRDELNDTPTVYTGPLDEYFDYSLGRLPWRTVDLVSETLDVDDFQGTAVMNYNDAEPLFTRILEHQHYDPQATTRKVPGKTIITREYSRFAEPGDEPYYPLNSTDSTELAKSYKKLAKAEESRGVFFGGRLAGYLYWDMWQASHAAMHLWSKRLKPLLSREGEPDL